MNFVRNNLANAFTLGNLFAGVIGVVHILKADYAVVALCMMISLILDFFDGFIARALKSNSNLGVQLDSLADMVSFGVIPGLAMFQMLKPFGSQLMGISLPFELSYLGIFITLFSCLRLAIFNIDEEQKFYFKGLNTPTNTVLIFGLLYTNVQYGSYNFLVNNALFLLILTLLSSWLLVSPIKMIAMKFKSMQLKDNYPKMALLLGGILLLAFFQLKAMPLLVIYYIFVSLIFQKQLSEK
ncbi:CDP-alcohol phosphatidyltransferase family protein [Bergeyella zoohelcum]|uniref:CDP-diacylglycerol-serine O-phosphatidyltransferase n=1 Tax=Bergeyella zoohelcum TaxID=1015 RepID=A0A376C1E4_9FLAO|nr:CDP-alcohol phosphatidyltransferase family protein [Bergeyella zoohelcum]EKB58525.1 CDP-diacylglycerol-serine O-phosphatidyltransferase [Bergeyella zoohelcum CCUG 30536]SSZ55892.1 CDP-diacylglycerol-serine O-phosphatidyltransferase [Bergeyella zoohelcum]